MQIPQIQETTPLLNFLSAEKFQFIIKKSFSFHYLIETGKIQWLDVLDCHQRHQQQ